MRLANLLAVGALISQVASAQALAMGTEVRFQISAPLSTLISAPMEGVISTLSIQEGDTLDDGVIAVEFDCRLKDAQIAKAKAQLDAANARHRSNLRLKELGSVSDIQVATSDAEKQMAQADLRYLKVELSNCAVAAPFTGVVGEVVATAHSFAKLGDPLFRFYDLTNLRATFIVPTLSLSGYTLGKEIQLYVEDLNRTVAAEVTAHAVEADPLTQTTKVFARLLGDAEGVFPGMSGSILESQ
ncbi:MAG: hypothetical protein HWE12_06385 [Oceanospirillaceae bacterium]|nr:hypothetical protein [Oceanospirillaceae bacterium]